MRRNDLIVSFIIIVVITAYVFPLLVNLDRAFSPDQKNCINMWYFAYFFGYFYKASVTFNHQFPFWCPFYEGGFPWIYHPADVSLNPFSLFMLMFGVVKGINISWYLLYILGALSMYYLTRAVFKFNPLGAFYSSIVFSMSGFFTYVQAKGYVFARETLLLPLLVAFFLKAESNNKYIVYAALLLGLIFIHTCLYLPVIGLLLFIIAVSKSVYKKNGKLFYSKRFIIVFIAVTTLSICYASPKLLPLVRFLNDYATVNSYSYLERVVQSNTFLLFMERLFSPRDLNAGTMYVGYLPVMLCLFSSVVLYKKTNRWLIILFIFIVLSFGPNASFDMHRILSYFPIFKAMRDIQKYYSLIIIFVISLISGSFFLIIEKKISKKDYYVLAIGIILITYFDLLWANIGYFNIYKTKLPTCVSAQELSHIKAINLHEGDEGGLLPLRLALYFKGYGLTNAKVWTPYFCYPEFAEAKYFVLPEYAFLMPSTKVVFIPNPDYHGELFFLNKENQVVSFSIVSNVIKAKVKVKNPDRLVINQAYSKNWSSDNGKVENYENKLSLKLDKIGVHEISLNFIAVDFYVGVLIAFLTLIASCVAIKYRFINQRREKHRRN